MYHISWINPTYTWGFIRHGYLMVDFFFVLSGFVICLNYSNTLQSLSDLKRFIWLRAGRLYPLHFVTLLFALGIETLTFIAEKTMSLSSPQPAFSVNNFAAFLGNLTLTQSLGFFNKYTFNETSWSISTEFYTYLVFSLLLLLNRKLFVLSSFLMVVATALFLFSINPTSIKHEYDFGFIRCIFGFFVGVVCCLVYSKFPTLLKNKSLLYILIGSSLGGILTTVSMGNNDYLFVGFCFLLVFSISVGTNTNLKFQFLEHRYLLFLGKISYSVYMLSFTFQWFFKAFLIFALKVPKTVNPSGGRWIVQTDSVTGTAATIIYLVLLLLAAKFLFELVEDPFRKKSKELANKWLPKEA